MNENEKRIELEGILYNDDQTFRPLTASHGNTDGELAFLRDTYMEAEKEYFEHLLAIDSIRENFIKYTSFDSEMLFQQAIQIQTRLETGTLETDEDIIKMQSMTPVERDNYHMQILGRAEGMISLLLAATRDKVKILELVKTYQAGRSM